MLVPFTDSEGREAWINPIHVKVVRTKKGLLGGKKGTEVWFSWTTGSESIKIPEEPSAVAMKLNAAMPEMIAQQPLPPFSPDDEGEGKAPMG